MRDDELQSLFQAVFDRYGWDFRCYARASLRRRVIRHMMREKISGAAALRTLVLNDPVAMDRLFSAITVPAIPTAKTKTTSAPGRLMRASEAVSPLSA